MLMAVMVVTAATEVAAVEVLAAVTALMPPAGQRPVMVAGEGPVVGEAQPQMVATRDLVVM